MAAGIGLTGSDQAVATGRGRYFGFTVAETGASSTKTIKVYDGTSATGTLLDTIRLAAGEASGDWYGPQGKNYSIGVFVDVAGSGTVEGSVFIG